VGLGALYNSLRSFLGVNYECFDPVECRAKHANPAEKKPLFLWCLFHDGSLYRPTGVRRYGTLAISHRVYSAILFFVSLSLQITITSTNKQRFKQKAKIETAKIKSLPSSRKQILECETRKGKNFWRFAVIVDKICFLFLEKDISIRKWIIMKMKESFV
jgi:hypothetical protein